jgi:hypothetical protein
MKNRKIKWQQSTEQSVETRQSSYCRLVTNQRSSTDVSTSTGHQTRHVLGTGKERARLTGVLTPTNGNVVKEKAELCIKIERFVDKNTAYGKCEGEG